MALTDKPRSRFWSRLHFLVLFTLLTGLLVGGLGLVWSLLEDRLTVEVLRQARADVQAGTYDAVPLSLWLLAGGAVAVALTLLIEIFGALRLVAGRRSAFGFNAAVQIALAAALLVAVNVYSFQHYLRFDWTRPPQKFTLPEDVRNQLRQLQGETTIVVYQRHKTFGTLSDKPDARDYAAERKVVEKVHDLVDQFRELGPQFRVVVLDVEEEGFDNKLAHETENEPELRAAIDSATENSIFFHAKGTSRVQRLSFNEFYQLDKSASKDQENLVLLFQGVEPFARKVLNIDEKKPTVGILVIHEWLTTLGPDEFGLAGVKKALTARGFEVREVILKKWSEFAPPEAAVYTYDENKLERVEEQLSGLSADLKGLEEEQKALEEMQKDWKSASLEELTKKYAPQLNGAKVTERIRQLNLPRIEQKLALAGLAIEQYRKERDETLKEKSGINVEDATEQRRMTDLKAKLGRTLAECDVLLIPRMTLRNVNLGDRIPNRLYRLDEAQISAIKDYVKSGKPILACFGPANEPADRPDPLGPAGPDDLENLLGDLGIKFGKQTVLFNVESKSFAERHSGLVVAGGNVEVPAVEFDWKPDALQSLAGLAKADATPEEPNPIRSAMRIMAHSLSKDLDLHLRHPRPVYFDGKSSSPFDPVIMICSEASWNDDQPFPSRERTPHYEPSKDDPNKGTLDEKRRGPFPVGVAVETMTPAAWYAESSGKPVPVRVAAIGHGGLFVGAELSPTREKLLLSTCNWLLGRDDHLPRDDRPWSFPRVNLEPQQKELWRWGTFLGLPAVFAYLGMVVLLVRRMR